MPDAAPLLTDSRRLSLVHIAGKFPNTGHQNVRLTDSIQMLLHYLAMDVVPGGGGEVTWGQMVQYVTDSVAAEALQRAQADDTERNARINADDSLGVRINNLVINYGELSTALVQHTSNTDIHVTVAEKNRWNGINSAYVFDTEAAMNSWLSIPANKSQLRPGDLLLIRALGQPDYWWDGTQPQILETKVDLVGYLPLTGGTMTGPIRFGTTAGSNVLLNEEGMILDNGNGQYTGEVFRLYDPARKSVIEGSAPGRLLVARYVTLPSGAIKEAGARLTYYGLLFTDQVDGTPFFNLENGAVSGNLATRDAFNAWLGTGGGGGGGDGYLPLTGGTMTGAINFTSTDSTGYRSSHSRVALSFGYSDPARANGGSSIAAESINCGSSTVPGTYAQLFNVAGNGTGTSCGLRLVNSNPASLHNFEIDIGKGTVSGTETMKTAMNNWLGTGTGGAYLPLAGGTMTGEIVNNSRQDVSIFSGTDSITLPNMPMSFRLTTGRITFGIAGNGINEVRGNASVDSAGLRAASRNSDNDVSGTATLIMTGSLGVLGGQLELSSGKDYSTLFRISTASKKVEGTADMKAAFNAWLGTGGGSLLTTKGDLLGYTTTAERIPVGTNGQVLTADSTAAGGVKWATPTATGSYLPLTGGTVTGDLTLSGGNFNVSSVSQFSGNAKFVKSVDIQTTLGQGVTVSGTGFLQMAGGTTFEVYNSVFQISGGTFSMSIDGIMKTISMSPSFKAAFRAALGI